MAHIIEYAIVGLDAVRAKLLDMTPTIRRKYARKALRKGAEVVKKVATTPGIVPELLNPIYRRGRLARKPGTVRDAIAIRNSKDVNRTGDVGVFVNVRPAKGGERGRYSPNDPFYWRFLEFGTKYMRKRPFLRVGGQQLEGQALREIEQSLGPDLQQMNLPGV
jgi:HK97 gp10 family phage protein